MFLWDESKLIISSVLSFPLYLSVRCIFVKHFEEYWRLRSYYLFICEILTNDIYRKKLSKTFKSKKVIEDRQKLI